MILTAIILGLGATVFMTLFVYFMNMMLNEKRVKVVHVLGTMLTNNTTYNKGLSSKPDVILIGTLAHYAVGVLFSLVYLFLVNKDIANLSYLSGILFGIVAGIFAVFICRAFFVIHPNPPIVPQNEYAFTIFCGHIVFGIAMIFLYNLLSGWKILPT